MDFFLLAQLETQIWTDIVAQYGPLVGIVLFFIWRDWKREDKLSERISTLEDYQKETLADLVSHSTVALTHSADCMKWVGSIMSKVCDRCPGLDECAEPPRAN